MPETNYLLSTSFHPITHTFNGLNHSIVADTIYALEIGTYQKVYLDITELSAGQFVCLSFWPLDFNVRTQEINCTHRYDTIGTHGMYVIPGNANLYIYAFAGGSRLSFNQLMVWTLYNETAV